MKTQKEVYELVLTGEWTWEQFQSWLQDQLQASYEYGYTEGGQDAAYDMSGE